jgi:hypothetical protein
MTMKRTMKTKISILPGAALCLLFTFGGTHVAAPQSWQVYFEDNFDGSAIDDSIWNTGLATSGKRWCQSSFGNSPPWVWQDISVEPWMGLTETPPYGTITVGGGLASFSAGAIASFPYIWCGPPSRNSPFPATGDFIYEFRWRLDSPGTQGNGIFTPLWPNTEPEADNNPFGLGSWGLWGDTAGGWHIDSPAGIGVPVLDPQVFHIFRLECINGAYSQYVDGILSAGPTQSNDRPNVIWIGNPIFSWWSQAGDDWSDFTIDYIQVLVPACLAQVQPPINADGSSVWTVKRGVVPVKFTLTCDGNPTCSLPAATIAVTRTAGGTTGTVNESVYSMSADTGSNFRIDGCQYIYNLSSSALGAGTYRVDILINSQVVGSATFQLK